MRAGQEWAGGTGHVLHLWRVAVREYPVPGDGPAGDGPAGPGPGPPVLRASGRGRRSTQRLREAQLAGHDVGELIDRVTADPLDGARSVSAVLHSRLAGLGLDDAA